MRILIIEDESEIAKFIKAGLEAECFSVDVAEDGEKGANLARANSYDLVILDNMLPKKSGLEACRLIREKKTVPILMLSVLSETEKKVELLNAGADDYITKPFSLEELLARIRALLRRPKQISGDILKVGDVALDQAKQVVKVNGKDVYLTRKEFSLLEYFMRNPDTVLSRSMILEHVWDMNADPFSNTIEAHVLSLRHKVEKGKKKIIQTIPGRGYKLTENA